MWRTVLPKQLSRTLHVLRMWKMPVAVARDEGVAAVAVVLDCISVLPSLCKIIETVCFYKGLLQPGVVSALGVRKSNKYFCHSICSYSLNGGLGMFSSFPHPFTGHTDRGGSHSEGFADLGAPYWLGIVVNTISINFRSSPFYSYYSYYHQYLHHDTDKITRRSFVLKNNIDNIFDLYETHGNKLVLHY